MKTNGEVVYYGCDIGSRSARPEATLERVRDRLERVRYEHVDLRQLHFILIN